MATLKQLCIEAGWGLQEFAGITGVSISTLLRIEQCARGNTSHAVQAYTAAKITYALGQRLGRRVTVEEIDGMHLAPPRTGRPPR